MEEKTLPTTEEELQKLIQDAVDNKVAEMTKQHNDDMAKLRTKAKQDQEQAVKKAIDSATLSAEEQAKKAQDERLDELTKENELLKAKAHAGDVKEALTKSQLPLFLSNDSRLANAKSEEEIASAIDEVKKDYLASLPNGSQVNTNVVTNQQTTSKKAEEDAKLQRFRNLGIK